MLTEHGHMIVESMTLIAQKRMWFTHELLGLACNESLVEIQHRSLSSLVCYSSIGGLNLRSFLCPTTALLNECHYTDYT